MNNDTPPADDPNYRTFGDYAITLEEAREDDNFRVLNLPTDMVEDHLTKTFTPSRYAKICRDVAYFSTTIGNAPHKNTGDGSSSPGSGMRRAKEGALYNLMHREAILTRAVDMGLINATNEGGFNASESNWTFSLTPRGAWFLHFYYGDHVPVRHVTKKQLSRHSAATNVKKILVDPETAANAKSVEEWNEQVKTHGTGMGDVDTGYYHVDVDTVDAPADDPADAGITAWIDGSRKPSQFNVNTIPVDVHVHNVVEELASLYDDDFTVKFMKITIDDDTGDLLIEPSDSVAPVNVVESNHQHIGIEGDYNPLVTTGAKDELKDAGASWSSDYERWYITPEKFLEGVAAMLMSTDLTVVTCPAHVIDEYSEYL